MTRRCPCKWRIEMHEPGGQGGLPLMRLLLIGGRRGRGGGDLGFASVRVSVRMQRGPPNHTPQAFGCKRRMKSARRIVGWIRYTRHGGRRSGRHWTGRRSWRSYLGGTRGKHWTVLVNRASGMTKESRVSRGRWGGGGRPSLKARYPQ
jgi:hypothetical protein